MTEEVRKKVTEEMKRRKISRYRLAEDLDMEKPSISRLLNGRSGKVPESWQKIFDYLGFEVTLKKKGEK